MSVRRVYPKFKKAYASRPEKEHYKQIRAMATLLKQHPEYREGEKRVTLTLMGGARHTADRARVEGLRKLASDLGIQDHVEFLVNAPYPEIERRLGEASIGLNTMQDEHFGINIVEFMVSLHCSMFQTRPADRNRPPDSFPSSMRPLDPRWTSLRPTMASKRAITPWRRKTSLTGSTMPSP